MAFCKIFIFSSQIKIILKFQHSLLLTFKTMDCHYLLACSSPGKSLGPAWFLFLGSLFWAWMFKNLFLSFVMQKPQAKSGFFLWILSGPLWVLSVFIQVFLCLRKPFLPIISLIITDFQFGGCFSSSRTTVILACLFSLYPVSILYPVTLIFVPFSPDSHKSFYLSQYVFYPA